MNMQKKFTLDKQSIPPQNPKTNEVKPKRNINSFGKKSDRNHAILDSLPFLICCFQPGGEILFVNEACRNYFDKTYDELVGSNFLKLIPEIEQRDILKSIAVLTVDAPALSYEHSVIAPGGDIRWQRWTHRAVFDEHGEVYEYQSIGEDVTDRRRAEEGLRDSEELHRIVLSNISDAVFITDDTGAFTFICPNVNIIFGYSYEEVNALGNIKELFGQLPFDRTELESSKELRNVEWVVHDKSGFSHNLLVNVKTVSINGGKLLYTCRDITERKQTEAELERQKDFLNTLLDTIPNPVFYKDTNGRYTGCNRAFEDFIGKLRSDIIGRTVYDLGPVDIAKKYYKMDQALLSKPGKQHYEWRVQSSDGVLRDVIFDKATIKNYGGKAIGLVGVISDITERKKTELALRKSESTLKAILAASPVGICLVRNRTLEWTNQSMHRIWGHEMDSLLGQNTSILYPNKEEYERIGREFYKLIEQNGKGKIETQWVTSKGEIIHCYLQGCPLNPLDPAKGIIVTAVDITERKQVENLVRSLSHRLIEAQENEKKMLSYELHDSIAQNLSYLKISCDTLLNNCSELRPEFREKMAKQSKIISQTIDAVRELSYGLRPPTIEQLGIKQTISQLCEEFSDTTGLNVDFVSYGIETIKQDSFLEINIYRLIQEGFNNIRKHADAKNIKIVLVASYPNIILRIQDDGKGFDMKARDAEPGRTKRMGLRSMTGRVNLLRGTIKIKSRPTQGTKIFIKIPLQYDSSAVG